MSRTKRINPQNLSPADKEEIKQLIGYGDVGRIAVRCRIGYQRVSDIIRNEEDHPEVWINALAYFRALPREAADAVISNQNSPEAA